MKRHIFPHYLYATHAICSYRVHILQLKGQVTYAQIVS